MINPRTVYAALGAEFAQVNTVSFPSAGLRGIKRDKRKEVKAMPVASTNTALGDTNQI
jgi:hypothetical protein